MRKLIFCIIFASAMALSAHACIQKFTQPIIAKMLESAAAVPSGYPSHIIIAAYLTALLTTSLLVYLYYHLGHLLKIKNKILKTLVISAVLLEIKGDLIRQPLMDYLYNIHLGTAHPALFVILNQADKWLPNLILAATLVYLCPLKNKN